MKFKVFVRKSYYTLAKKISFPTFLSRAILGYVSERDSSFVKETSEVFGDIYSTNMWRSRESKSGTGSSLEATTMIRQNLPIMIEKFSIKSMLDVPCGDYNWMKMVKKDCNYIGGDIVADLIKENQKLYAGENVRFEQIDITKDSLPTVDLIFCRDCLQHLNHENVRKAINNFKSSNSKYLLVTSYSKTKKNRDINDGNYYPLNLILSPFHFPKPIFEINENRSKGNESDKIMYLYELKNIPFYTTEIVEKG